MELAPQVTHGAALIILSKEPSENLATYSKLSDKKKIPFHLASCWLLLKQPPGTHNPHPPQPPGPSDKT